MIACLLVLRVTGVVLRWVWWTFLIHAPDPILVSSGGGTYLLYGPAGVLFRSQVLIAEAKALGSISNRDYTAAVFEGNVGVISYHINENSTERVWTFDGEVEVAGNPFEMGCNEKVSAYLLSYTFNESSVLYRYNYTPAFIKGQVEIQGYPLDLQVTTSNNVFVLTAID